MRWWLCISYTWAQLPGAATASLNLYGSTTVYPLGYNPAVCDTFRYIMEGSASSLWGFQELIQGGWGMRLRLAPRQHVLLSTQYLSFDKFTHVDAGLGYVLAALPEKVFVAVRGWIQHTNWSEYGNQTRLSPDVGFFVRLSSRVFLGGAGHNLLRTGWGNLPGRSLWLSGIQYAPSDKVRIFTEVSHLTGQSPTFHMATEYQPINAFTLRVGSSFPNMRLAAGIALAYKNWALDIGNDWQNVTALRTWLGLRYWH
ncbi:MAG: hypothetical protein ACUVRD_04830 [Bacteroidia bacterium]